MPGDFLKEDMEHLLRKVREENRNTGSTTKIMSTNNIDKFKLDGQEIEMISSMNILVALVTTDCT